jgi:hypothetical protein
MKRARGSGDMAELNMSMTIRMAGSAHGRSRRAQLTGAGTMLVVRMDRGKAIEFAPDGKEQRPVDVASIWSVQPLSNGIILAVSKEGFVGELNRRPISVQRDDSASGPAGELL